MIGVEKDIAPINRKDFAVAKEAAACIAVEATNL